MTDDVGPHDPIEMQGWRETAYILRQQRNRAVQRASNAATEERDKIVRWLHSQYATELASRIWRGEHDVHDTEAPI